MTARSLAQLTPHTAAVATVTVDGLPLAALWARPVDPVGAVALLVPGYTGSKEDFAALFDGLAAAGLEALAVDLPGQHESPGLPREQDHYPEPLGRIVASLVRDLAATGDRVLLLGHSYGGFVARSAVLSGAPVTGLTLLSTGPGALPAGPRRALLEAAEPVLRGEGAEAVLRLREAVEGTPEPPELAALLRARFLNSAPAALLGMAHRLRTESDRVAELAATLRTRRLPCLVVCGAADEAWPAPVQREMATRLGAPIAVLPGAGHSPNTEDPRALLHALLPVWHRWLGSATTQLA